MKGLEHLTLGSINANKLSREGFLSGNGLVDTMSLPHHIRVFGYKR